MACLGRILDIISALKKEKGVFMRIEGEFLVLDNERIKNKKITGTTFVSLCGKDRFNKKGDTILQMMGIYKPDVPEKYLWRGSFAEDIVRRTYIKYGHKPVVYDKFEIQFDNFKDINPLLGGLIDIELPEESTLIEVKSKSMKDYEKYQTYEDEKEIYQGAFYAYLRKYKYFYMEWIFFDKPTEDELFENKKPTTIMNLKRISRKYDTNREDIDKLIEIAIDYKNKCYNSKMIPLCDISDKVLKELNIK